MLRTFAIGIQALLDTVLPRKERSVRIDHYRAEDLPVSPLAHEACGVEITTLMQYREKIVEDVIRALKYDRSGLAATLLAGALAEYLREEIANIRAFSRLPVFLVPVPLHGARLRERGFNQIELVLQMLPPEFLDGTAARVRTDVLIRCRPTSPQTRLSRAARLTNVAGAFALVRPVDDAHIILIDDVTTTGATLAEAAKPFGAIPLSLLALAHA